MEDDNVLAQTLVNYEMLIDMIPELEDLVDTGIVTEEIARAIYKELSPVHKENFVESLDITKRIIKNYDSRIKEMENDIAAKTVVETPADYIPVKKQNRDLESKNDFLEARLRKLDKENGQLKRQIMELQQKLDPVQEHQRKVHEDVQLFSGKIAAYIAEMGKFGYLKDEIQNASVDDMEVYERAIQKVKNWIAGIEKENMEIAV